MPESKRVIWRRLLPPALLACLVVLFRAFQDYQREGRITTVNVEVTAMTLAVLAVILNVVVWYVTRDGSPRT